MNFGTQAWRPGRSGQLRTPQHLYQLFGPNLIDLIPYTNIRLNYTHITINLFQISCNEDSKPLDLNQAKLNMSLAQLEL